MGDTFHWVSLSSRSGTLNPVITLHSKNIFIQKKSKVSHRVDNNKHCTTTYVYMKRLLCNHFFRLFVKSSVQRTMVSYVRDQLMYIINIAETGRCVGVNIMLIIYFIIGLTTKLDLRFLSAQGFG
jgi:hypothetical protein